MPSWIETKYQKPTEGVPVNTRVDDEKGIRNEQVLIYQSNLWWVADMAMYVYYTPTHWHY